MVTLETKDFINEYCRVHIAEHKKVVSSLTRQLKRVHNCFETTELKRMLYERRGAIQQLEQLRYCVI